MKTKNIIFICIFFITSFFSFGQKQIIVEESIQPMLKGNQPGFIVDIPQAKVDAVETAWKKAIGGSFIDNIFTKGNSQRIQNVGDELVLLNTIFEPVSSDSINIYSQIFNKNGGVRLVVFFEHDTTFVQNTESGEWEDHIAQKAFGAKNFLREFAINQYRKAVEEDLKDKKVIFRNLERELLSLENDTEKKLIGIESNKQKILNADDEINVLDSDLETTSIEIQQQKLIVSELKKGDKDAYSEAKKELKSLEKEKKRMQNKQGNLRKKIVKSEVEIQVSERTIVSNKVEKKYKLKEIDEQKVIVETVEDKLKNIK